jgi:hypothetical protein
VKIILLFVTIIPFLAIPLAGCFEENDTTGPVDPKYFSKKISEVVSPQQDRVVEIYEGGNSNDSSTQIIVSFGWPEEYGGSGVFTAKGINLGIKVDWQDEDNVMVTYKSDLQVIIPMTRTFAKLFNEEVNIHYNILKK